MGHWLSSRNVVFQNVLLHQSLLLLMNGSVFWQFRELIVKDLLESIILGVKIDSKHLMVVLEKSHYLFLLFLLLKLLSSVRVWR